MSIEAGTGTRWRGRARAAAVLALFLALPFVVFWRFVPGLSSLTLGNDYVVYPFDAQLEIVWAWSRGLVPLYVPGFGGGYSVSALTLGQAWHPITWLAALTPGYGAGRAEVIVTTLRLLELGLTHYALHRASRNAGLGAMPSFLLTFAVVFNGRMLDSFRYGSSLENYCGALLACAALASGHRRGWSARDVVLAAGAVFLTLVGGHPQWALFGVMGAGLFGLLLPVVARHLAAPPPPTSVGRHLVGLATSCAAGGALAAGYLLPFQLEFMKQNAGRVDQSYAFTVGYGDTVRGTLASFVRPLESDVHGAFGGTVLFLVVICSGLAALAARRRVPVSILLPLGVVVLTLLFALGRATPVHRWMVESLPLFSSFRVPGRMNLLLPPMVLLIGWLALADVERPDLLRARVKVPSIVFGTLVAAAAMLAFQAVARAVEPSAHAPPFITAVPPWATTTLVALFGATLGALTLVGFPRMRAASWAIAILATVAAASIAMSYGTWTTQRKPTRTLEAIDAHHRKKLSFVGDNGYGMTTRIVTEATAAGIATKRPAGSLLGTGMVEPRSIHWNEWVFDVTAPDGGTFVFGQPSYPEWRATVDGEAAPIATHDRLFASVTVAPGRHVVAFRWVSMPSTVGGAMFFVSLAALAAAWVRPWRLGRARATMALLAILGLVGGVGVAWFGAHSPELNLVERAPAERG